MEKGDGSSYSSGGSWPPVLSTSLLPHSHEFSSSSTFLNQWRSAARSINQRTPIWNRCYLLACDIGPSLAHYGPGLDNVELESCCSRSYLEDDGAFTKCLSSYYALTQEPTLGELIPLVYVPTLALPSFVERILPIIPFTRKFVLVSGLSDYGPAKSLGKGNVTAGTRDFIQLVSDPRIITMWAENLDVDVELLDNKSTNLFSKETAQLRIGLERIHEKIKALPLGIDLHTLCFKQQARPGWGPTATISDQTDMLERAVVNATHKDKRCWICWGILNRKRKAITDALIQSFPDKFIVEDTSPSGSSLTREEFWGQMGGFASAVSVEGYSLDTHRTWEALALGCGVIVQDNPLTRSILSGGHFENVVFVKDSKDGSKAWASASFERESIKPGDDQITLSLQRILGDQYEDALYSKEKKKKRMECFGRLGMSLLSEDDVDQCFDDNQSVLNPLLLSMTWMQALRNSATSTTINVARNPL